LGDLHSVSHRIVETLIMAHRRTAYNRLAAPEIQTKSRQQCASESGEVLEIRNRLSFKDHGYILATGFVWGDQALWTERHRQPPGEESPK